MITKVNSNISKETLIKALQEIINKVPKEELVDYLDPYYYSIVSEESFFEKQINLLEDLDDLIDQTNYKKLEDPHFKELLLELDQLLSRIQYAVTNRLEEKPKTNLSILNTKEWSEFDNQFEEDFEGNPNVYRLLNGEHHKEVAALAAQNLSKVYYSIDEIITHHNIMQKAYNEAAKLLYPEERLWSGTEYKDTLKSPQGDAGPEP